MPASADCPPSCPLTTGGTPATDCHAEFASTAMRLNSPFFNPAKGKPSKEHACFDGDAGCDLDGVVNNECVFDIDLCLHNDDPNLPDCAVADVTEVSIKGNATKIPALATLQSAVSALLPATTNVCTSGVTLTLPLKGPTGKGDYKPTKAAVKVLTRAGGVDKDTLRLRCVPHNWPSHGFGWTNQRSTPLETKITTANVSSLVEKWDFYEVQRDVEVSPGVFETQTVPVGAVSSTPTVDAKQVYVTSWDGHVYAVQAKTGKLKWDFDTESAGQMGLQSSATVTADGRVLVGDSTGKLFCLSAKKGELLWKKDTVGTVEPSAAHIWASPTVVNGRVLMGVASHNDTPCVQGQIVALDLDTGDELWTYQTVPDAVCFTDTTVPCDENTVCPVGSALCDVGFCTNKPEQSCTPATEATDCAAVIFSTPGTCVTTPSCRTAPASTCTTNADCSSCAEIRGGGVSATAAVDQSGDTVYLATVGCLSQPSIGNSDSIIALDAATGAEQWVLRTQSIEQLVDGPPYHDYGFLNGPIVADVDDGLGGTVRVVAAASKDGSFYAADAATGVPVWTNVVAPAPDFAGFGLFNGAPGFADGRFFATAFGASPFVGWANADPDLLAFSGEDGTTAWSAEIGRSWGDIAVANGIVFAGTLSGATLTAYDAASGAALASIAVPGTVTGGATIVNGTLYVPYGLGGRSGVKAFELP